MEQAPVSIEKFSCVRQHRQMLANANFYLNPDSRILDFGCGEGNLVYEYRDAGFNAYGFDIRPAPKFRRPEDEQYFRFALTGKPVNVPEFEVHESFYKVPFEDEFFDFVYSTSTLEHVINFDLALIETARVLRSGGVAIHTFPSRYMPIEPHMYVPFGGFVQTYLWFLLWALLGVRNEFQKQMGPTEVAKMNLRYSRSGLNYARLRDIFRISKKHFREVELIPRLWEMGEKGYMGSVKGQLLCMPLLHPFFGWLYNHFCTVVLFLRK